MPPEPHSLSFQLLCARVFIHFDDPCLEPWIKYVSVNAEQPVSAATNLNYRVTGLGPYEILEEEDLVARTDSPCDIQFHIYRRAYQRTLERYVLGGWIGLHGGLVSIRNERILLLGNKGAGKTTLTSSLLFSNHEIEGDEMVLVQNDTAMAFPRRLHIKPGTEAQVPDLTPLLPGLPTASSDGQLLHGLDPTEIGRPWKIRSGRLDHVVWIEPNHGNDTHLKNLSSLDTVQRLTDSYLGWGQTKSQVFNYCSALARHGGHELALGDPRGGIKLLEQLTQKAP